MHKGVDCPVWDLILYWSEFNEDMMTQLRQKLLVLYAHSPDLHSQAVAWSLYDGTGRDRSSSGDGEEPPYASVVARCRTAGGWSNFHSNTRPIREWNTIHLI